MATDIQLADITTNVSTDFPVDSIGQGWSISLSGQSAGTAALRKKLPDGTYIAITDDDGVAKIISAFPTTINQFVGSGARLNILTASIAGALKVTLNPLKSEK